MPRSEELSGEPLLSLITVHRDDEEGLTKTFQSFGTRRHPLVEHIVIDGSSDAGLVHRASVKTGFRPTRVVWREPRGIYDAMNQGIASAQGAYILFINAGDELQNPSVPGALVERLSECSVDWLFGRVMYVMHSGLTRQAPAFDYSHERKRKFRHGRFPLQPGTVVRTKLLRQLGGLDTRFGIAADYHLMLRLAQVSEPIEVDQVIARFALGGASSQHWRRSLQEAHSARVEALQLGSVAKKLDLVYVFAGSIRAIASRILGRV